MKLDGWILDLYPCPQGMTIWLQTPNQTTHRLIDSFEPDFYVHGDRTQLKRLKEALSRRAPGVTTRHTERQDIWQARAIEVLEITIKQSTALRSWVWWVHQFDPRLKLYNSDIMLASFYCWQRKVFPLARVEVEADPEGRITEIECRDDPWQIDYELPPMKVMRVRLEGLGRVDPKHGRRELLEVQIEDECFVLDEYGEPAALSFQHMLKKYDPDLILTEWGDSTILPLLREQARRLKLSLSLNRDPDVEIQQSRSRSFMSYGRILFKDSATTLFGRLHVDTYNSFIADKCDLSGLWESVRVTKLPIQYAARTSMGTGISYMQMELAYRDGVLIPEQKAEPEELKSPDELLLADRGGLVFLPQTGFHENVAELDFVSEYPSIMARFNISPETVNCRCCPDAPRVPELGYRVCQKRRGITSRVVEKLIVKKDQYKLRQHEAKSYKLRRDALKWLLVCCFGYTGYRNARFGKIEAHEAINAVARETLLVAKEIAENQGYQVIHGLVDSLYVQRFGATRSDFEQLAKDVEQATKLPIALEAVYRYVIFFPSKEFSDVPVPNRFFAVSEDGELKVRGLESRRHDTPPIVGRMQREVLEVLAEAHDYESYGQKLEEAREIFQSYREGVEQGRVAIQDLVINKRLTRPPKAYKKANLTAIVAQQLYGSGVHLRPGQMVQYIITDAKNPLPNDRVRAFALWEGWHGYDHKKYGELLEEAFKLFEHPQNAFRTPQT